MLGYEELTEPERAVWNAVEAGALVQLPLSAPAPDDPATGETWGEDRQVRAQLLYELLAGGNGPKDVRPRALRLAGARISGTLDLEAATLACPLSLRRCYLDRAIILREAQAYAVRLPGCRVVGLEGEQLRTQGDLELDEGFIANGEVRLAAAHIGGLLNLQGATLVNPNGRALFADGLIVDLGMFCRAGFRAEGEIRLVGAHIRGQLDFNGATLINPGGLALTADGLIVDKPMFCRAGFRAEGEVNLVGAQIAGHLDFRGATLINPDGTALGLVRVRTPSLFLQPKVAPEGTVDLTDAKVDACYDSRDTWPRDLRLDGFVYGVLVAEPEVAATERLRWLGRDQSGYRPQLYEQLTSAYRKAGRDDDARKVAIAKQRHHRQTHSWRGKAWNSLLHWTVGYGYQTWKAGVWLLVLIGLGWWIFDRAHPAHLVAAKPAGQRPEFHAGLYALDLLLPFADLGYQGSWIAGGWARGFYLGWNLAGWILITAVVAALSGLIKRD